MKKITKIILTGTAAAAGAFAYSVLTDRKGEKAGHAPRHSTSSSAEWIARRKQVMKEKAAKTTARKSSGTPALTASTAERKTLVPAAEETAGQRKGEIS